MILQTNPKATEVFENYPDTVRPRMLELRELVLKTASEIEGLRRLRGNPEMGGTQLPFQGRQYTSHGLEIQKTGPICALL